MSEYKYLFTPVFEIAENMQISTAVRRRPTLLLKRPWLRRQTCECETKFLFYSQDGAKSKYRTCQIKTFSILHYKSKPLQIHSAKKVDAVFFLLFFKWIFDLNWRWQAIGMTTFTHESTWPFHNKWVFERIFFF